MSTYVSDGDKYSVIFLKYTCELNDVHIFTTPDQSKLREILEPLCLPTDEYWVLPPLPFPDDNYFEIFDAALSKMGKSPLAPKNRRKLMSNLFLEALKAEATCLCSPIVIKLSQRETLEFMYKIGGSNLRRFISQESLQILAASMKIEKLSDISLVDQSI